MSIQTLKGFRDFLPLEKRQRDFVMEKIREVFERFGFEPLETPTLEYANLLLGKYGKEADRLVYTFEDEGGRMIGLRYDQTVPTARVLAQYQNELPKYFRRYQIQNVFRAEKPQRGRFREFTQCDIDIFGSTDPLSDAEILACTYFAYKNVGFPTVTLKINDRQVLFNQLKPYATPEVSVLSIIQTIDKLDKISEAEVIDELVKKGLAKTQAEAALPAISNAKVSENLGSIIALSENLGIPNNDMVFTPALARGLDYYTGMIFEVSVPEYGTNSLGGGGRYDTLIEQLGGVNIPAVGIAFGFDRIVEAAVQLDLITLENLGTQILVTVFNPTLLSDSVDLVKNMRAQNINAEIFINPNDKLDKQLKYADKKGIPYVVIVGPEEKEKGVVKLKNMQTKEQKSLTVTELLATLK
ncbi:histidine--tRNA ligase [Candidatus Microgenomates bacterium]|nr:MAG: histidine--tRNA ligase [Candidatus Microgenomates bacterium]